VANSPRVPPPEITALMEKWHAATIRLMRGGADDGDVDAVRVTRAELDRAIAALAEDSARLDWCLTNARITPWDHTLDTGETRKGIDACIKATEAARSTPSEARHEPQQPHEG
jgi:hypothetical protein